SVSAVLEEIIKEYLPLANKKALKLVPVFSAEDDMVYADQASIANAFANLMDNAVKFTEAGQISVTVFKNEKNELSVEFRDDGIGISDEYIANLFAPYTQEQSGFGRAYEGVGLGLSITKRILDLNRAGISVWSKKNKGSIFTVSFSLQSTTESEAVTIERNDSSTIGTTALTAIQPEEKPSILVVEDDGINQVYIRSILKNRFNVFLASDAKKALELFAEIQFNVVLMDISLKKGLNGLELTQLIRNGNRNKHTPIIAVTGHAFPEDMKRSLEAGCNEYLSKPFSETDLLLKISPFVDT
ncbi:MAG: response regulator, partial [Ignavibacteriales bacterium]|nr:response regulator [Ignavibacteriales bacterium]